MAFPLTDEEVRVLGVLIEKQRSTPDYYPMTLNALVNACNQKSNRHPVTAYGESEVMQALDGLQRSRLVGTVSGASSRSLKYRHALTEVWELTEAEAAVLASMMLRGPETVGELRGRTHRMHAFESLEEVEATLATLQARELPLVVHLPRQAGQKEARYAHLLSGTPDPDAYTIEQPTTHEARIAALEEEVGVLHEQLQTLDAAFQAFRAEFE